MCRGRRAACHPTHHISCTASPLGRGVLPDDSPQGFAASNALFKDWLAGLFRRARGRGGVVAGFVLWQPENRAGRGGPHSAEAASPACQPGGPLSPRRRLRLPCSFPVAIPGTAFARGLKARRGLMQRIHASLDLLEARAAAQAARTAGGQAKGSHEGSAAEHQQQEQEQRTALSLLLDSRDESGAHLSRQAGGGREGGAGDGGGPANGGADSAGTARLLAACSVDVHSLLDSLLCVTAILVPHPDPLPDAQEPDRRHGPGHGARAVVTGGSQHAAACTGVVCQAGGMHVGSLKRWGGPMH